MPRLGYWIGRPYWGKGLATEAVAALTDFAFGKFAGAGRIGGGVFVDNPASRVVLEKLGFERRGSYPFFCVSRGESVELDDMHLTRERWAASRGRA
jgi:RimJ/RimL family protein N-acetyltransferase